MEYVTSPNAIKPFSLKHHSLLEMQQQKFIQVSVLGGCVGNALINYINPSKTKLTLHAHFGIVFHLKPAFYTVVVSLKLKLLGSTSAVCLQTFKCPYLAPSTVYLRKERSSALSIH